MVTPNDKITNGSGSIRRALPEIKVELPRDIFTPRADEYIGEDGELHCKYCNGLRSHTYKGRRMRCICKNQELERNMRELKRENEAKYEEVRKLQIASLLGKDYAMSSFDNTETGRSESFDKAYDLCKRYCESLDLVEKHGQGLYLYGKLGCGKTHLAACMANAIMQKCRPVVFTNFFKILLAIRGKSGKGEEAFLEQLSKVDFLFIDDLGTERYLTKDGTESWVQEYLFNILNDRVVERKPTIFTSNYGLTTLVREKGLQPRIGERIYKLTGQFSIEIDAPNYRKEQVKKQEPIF